MYVFYVLFLVFQLCLGSFREFLVSTVGVVWWLFSGIFGGGLCVFSWFFSYLCWIFGRLCFLLEFQGGCFKVVYGFLGSLWEYFCRFLGVFGSFCGCFLEF